MRSFVVTLNGDSLNALNRIVSMLRRKRYDVSFLKFFSENGNDMIELSINTENDMSVFVCQIEKLVNVLSVKEI